MGSGRLTWVILPALILSACNLPGGSPGVDQQVAAALTVDAELTRRAQEAAEQATTPAPTDTLAPPTETPVPATATPEPPTATSVPAGCTDRARFVSDVTYPDGADVTAGAPFEKVWRLQNDGTCTWSASYSLVFDHGDAMGAPAAVPLSGTVAPGATVDLSVDLQAPASPGEYQGFFLLRNNAGVLFGIGANANTAFWVKIEVPSPTPTISATGLVIIPNITLIPLLYSSSGQDHNLLDGSCFDLDGGNDIGCGSGDADIRFRPELEASGGFPVTFEFVQKIEPRNGSKIRFAGGEVPSKADCEGMSLGTSAIDVDPGDYYCYQTSGSRYGWIHVDSADQVTLRFDWGTYK